MAFYRMDRFGIVSAGAGTSSMLGPSVLGAKGIAPATMALSPSPPAMTQAAAILNWKAGGETASPTTSPNPQPSSVPDPTPQQDPYTGTYVPGTNLPVIGPTSLAYAATGDDGSTPWGLYVGLGVGALALLGGVGFFLKKRSAAPAKTAGYRRRRRRR